MTGAHTLAARATLGGVAAACSVALASTKRFLEAGQRRFDQATLAALVVSRLSLYLLIFFDLHVAPRGDIPVFYRPEALCVLHGQLPYREFASSYAPLHGYLDAIVLQIWNSPLALILFAILVEAFAFPLFLRVARGGFSESQVRVAALLYVASPVSLQFVTVDGQDNILIALLLAASILSLQRGRSAVSGAYFALGVVLVKFLPLLLLPILLFASRERGRWIAGFGTVLTLGYLPFALLRLPLLSPLRAEGQAKTASDLPYLLESLLGRNLPGHAEDLVLIVVLLAVLWGCSRGLLQASAQVRARAIVAGCAAMVLALLLFSKKSWPPYLMLVWFPVCLMVVARGPRRAHLVAFAGFSWVAILAHSIWATVFLQTLGPDLHLYLMAGQWHALGFFATQLLLVGGYAWLLAVALKECAAVPSYRGATREPISLVPMWER